MLIVFYSLLMLGVGRCTDDQNFVTKTVGVGQSVTLSCTHQRSGDTETLFWIKLVPGKLPEILGRATSFDYEFVNEIPHITFTKEPERSDLSITETKLSHTAFYYCLKSLSQRYKIMFLKGAFLRVEGAEPDITAVVQVPSSGWVYSGDSVSLQCSVFSDSGNKTCPGGLGAYWFRAGSHESHPSVVYAHGNSGDECETSPEARCVYNFFKENISSSDSGTYYCAVATCGRIIFGNGKKMVVEAPYYMCSVYLDLFILLCPVMVLILIVIALLIYGIKSDRSKAAVATQKYSGGLKNRQRDGDMYSSAIFTMITDDSGALKDPNSAEKARIDAVFKAFWLD
ncbi:signal-regulatory protein beta-2-like [Chaetodon auriga]|uniref:signal-regulatory protein beta-2-like n=1 Tax=Chaetodon auriga TaxID=39042 RepID=UPI0040329FBC